MAWLGPEVYVPVAHTVHAWSVLTLPGRAHVLAGHALGPGRAARGVTARAERPARASRARPVARRRARRAHVLASHARGPRATARGVEVHRVLAHGTRRALAVRLRRAGRAHVLTSATDRPCHAGRLGVSVVVIRARRALLERYPAATTAHARERREQTHQHRRPSGERWFPTLRSPPHACVSRPVTLHFAMVSLPLPLNAPPMTVPEYCIHVTLRRNPLVGEAARRRHLPWRAASRRHIRKVLRRHRRPACTRSSLRHLRRLRARPTLGGTLRLTRQLPPRREKRHSHGHRHTKASDSLVQLHRTRLVDLSASAERTTPLPQP
jgi:hypothetical protein